MVDLTPEEKEQIYKEEKARLEAQEKIKAELNAKEAKDGTIGCLVFLGIVVVVMLYFFVFKSISDATGISAPTKTTTSSNIKSIGQRGKLFSEKDSSVLIAVDEKSLKELIKVFAADDEAGFAELLISGKVFEVNNNTNVLILDVGYGSYKIRILDGERAYETGWTFKEFVK